MKAHEYWSVGALITMLGTFYYSSERTDGTDR